MLKVFSVDVRLDHLLSSGGMFALFTFLLMSISSQKPKRYYNDHKKRERERFLVVGCFIIAHMCYILLLMEIYIPKYVCDHEKKIMEKNEEKILFDRVN